MLAKDVNQWTLFMPRAAGIGLGASLSEGLQILSKKEWTPLIFPRSDNFHRPRIPNQNKEYRDLDYKPLTNQGDNSLNLQGALADFRSIALAFHTEFFNTRFENGLKGYDSPWLNKNLFEPWAMGEILGHILTQENMQGVP